MEPRERFRPFTNDSTTHIRLREPQLAAVICQLRWPQLTAMEEELKPRALEFGRSLMEAYPVFSEAQQVSLTITADGVSQAQGDPVFGWSSPDSVWQISLTKRSVALSCFSFTANAEFADHLQTIIDKVHSHLPVAILDRVGLRYINRYDDARVLADPSLFFDASALGYAALPLDGVTLVANVNQAGFQAEDVSLQARSGRVPAAQTFDPSLAPLPGPSWVVDLDAYVERRLVSSVETDMRLISKLADTAYDFFKLIAKPELSRLFGGDAT